ncbi:MAG: AzlC family ABC transporter permease [Chloroflexi bacterium]|nr:AzlC family ABC transporter permease [Chloroflexota bacterium]
MTENVKEESRPEVDFTAAGAWIGFRQSLPVALSVFAYGLVFGVLAKQANLSFLEALLMSVLVFAGASQFTALGLWVVPLPSLTIILTTFIINLRHILMGASLYPYIRHLKTLPRNVILYFMSDESWALTMGQFQSGKRNGAFLLGSGFVIGLGWWGSTVVGYLLGNLIEHPEQWGLDFAFLAVFIALLVAQWKGKKNILPWLVAGIVAVVAKFLLPDKWYILLGGLAGSLVGAWLNDD